MKVSNQFFEQTKKIANDFIQSIIFIDDEANNAQSEGGDHQLNSLEITKGFAMSHKICAVYSPSDEKDVLALAHICKKADVVVLDWKIDLKLTLPEGTEEVDAESEDPRGRYTIQIINDVISDEETGKESLKLIIVYTGETNLWDITDTIYNSLSQIEHIQKDDFSVFSNNFKILIVGKPTLKAKHIPEIENRIIDWNQLPDFILCEFTKMTTGLLSSVVLKSLIAVRKKVFRLIKTFPARMDPAFLSHKALLPNPDDAEEQLLDLIGSEIKSILKSYDPGYYLSNDYVKDYIEAYYEDKEYEFPFDSTSLPSIEIPKTINRTLLNKFTEQGIERIFLKKDTPSQERRIFSSSSHRMIADLYTKNEEESVESNFQFALLTSVKTNYNPKVEPLLTLGTILRKDDDSYWLCIQPKCDTVRIEKNRDFLLLSLKKMENYHDGFHFLTKHKKQYLLFKINYSIYKSQFYKFKANKNQTVRGVFENGKVLIKGNTIMEWIGELKNDFSQSVANVFASELSRVGMDHSEWLRRFSSF